MTALLRSLSAVDAAEVVGGKARSLQQMTALGLPVPEARVLTTACFDAALRRHRAEVDRLCGGLRVDDLRGIEAASARLGERLTTLPLPDEVQAALAQVVTELGDGPYIVRSSAVGEDSARASFAGQLDSFFPVYRDGLEAAVRCCWASRYGVRALSYERQRGVALRSMAVVVQRLVVAKSAGVLFTDGAWLHGEACLGQGEALVSGRVTPAAFRLDRRLAEGARHGGVRVDRVSDDTPELPLTPAEAQELARVATVLERRQGRALDLEFAVDQAGKVWLVQARPITTHATQLWSNANICENFPGPVTPLLYSVAREGYASYFRNLGRAFGIPEARLAANEDAFAGVIGSHGARLYYNLSNIHRLLRLAPFGDALVDAFDLFVGAGESDPAGARSLATHARELAGFVLRASGAFATLPRRIRRFEARVDAFAHRFPPRALPALSDRELVEGVQGFVDLRCRRWLDASLCDAAAMLSYAGLKAFLERHVVGGGDGALHHQLLKGLDGLASAQPISELYALAALVQADAGARAALVSTAGGTTKEAWETFLAAAPAGLRVQAERYLERWGFRGSGELMLTEPGFQEEPGRLLPILARYVESDLESPAARLEVQRAERLETVRQVRSTFRGAKRALRPVFDALLVATWRAVAYRERARLKQALLYSRLRRIALELGARLTKRGTLESASDVFLLAHHEVVDAVRGTGFFAGALRDVLAQRRAEHARLSRADLPGVFTLPVGAAVPVEDEPSEALRTEAPEREGELAGQPASAGTVRGRAAVLAGLEEAGALRTGDVLVTKQTDPGWAPLFFLVKGLVMEKGGMLSHGSILARELGIPSVVGVPDATGRLPHGCEIEVDGDRGRVRLAR